MPLPTVESVSLAYKIANLSWEIGKAVRNTVGSQWSRSPYRLVSSLTTLEFFQNGDVQIADYVQDRLLRFNRDDQRLPPFVYGTDPKKDTIDQLLVNGTPHDFLYDQDEGTIRSKTDLLFKKGDEARAVLLAHSENGFASKRESFTVNAGYWTDSITMAIVFPSNRKPEHLEMLYRGPRDDPGQWYPATGEKYEVRRTTQGRLAFAWEGKNLRQGNIYKIIWDW